MTDYIELKLDEEVYNRVKKAYESYNGINLSFDEFVNYLIQVGLDNDE